MKLQIILLIIIILVGGTGYVKNIIKLTQCDFEVEGSYKCEVIHTIGLYPAVGGVTGYLDLGE